MQMDALQHAPRTRRPAAPPRPRGALVVVSPHLDDAVLACGDLLGSAPGAVALTLFAGRPPARAAPTPWDAACGFRPGDDVIGCRRAEDRAALAVLGAAPVWLDFRDAQYGPPTTTAALARAFRAALTVLAPRLVALPLGLFHHDHERASDAALRVVRRFPGPAWLVYAEALYRGLPGLVSRRRRRLARAGFRLVPVLPPRPAASPAKRRAVACYGSQLRGLATPGRLGHDDAFAPETYWRLLR
jgi:LmbE family N-acetylglucosaminyl deacetylase